MRACSDCMSLASSSCHEIWKTTMTQNCGDPMIFQSPTKNHAAELVSFPIGRGDKRKKYHKLPIWIASSAIAVEKSTAKPPTLSLRQNTQISRICFSLLTKRHRIKSEYIFGGIALREFLNRLVMRKRIHAQPTFPRNGQKKGGKRRRDSVVRIITRRI